MPVADAVPLTVPVESPVSRSTTGSLALRPDTFTVSGFSLTTTTAALAARTLCASPAVARPRPSASTSAATAAVLTPVRRSTAYFTDLM